MNAFTTPSPYETPYTSLRPKHIEQWIKHLFQGPRKIHILLLIVLTPFSPGIAPQLQRKAARLPQRSIPRRKASTKLRPCSISL